MQAASDIIVDGGDLEVSMQSAVSDDPATAFRDEFPSLAPLVDEMDELFAGYVSGVAARKALTTNGALLNATRPLDLLQYAGIPAERIAEVASVLLARWTERRAVGVRKSLGVTVNSLYRARTEVARVFRADLPLRIPYHLRHGQDAVTAATGRGSPLLSEAAGYERWCKERGAAIASKAPQTAGGMSTGFPVDRKPAAAPTVVPSALATPPALPGAVGVPKGAASPGPVGPRQAPPPRAGAQPPPIRPLVPSSVPAQVKAPELPSTQRQPVKEPDPERAAKIAALEGGVDRKAAAQGQ